MLSLAAVDCAAFHYEGDVLEDSDVFQGVAGDGDDVGVVARLEDAEVVFPVEEAGSVEKIGLEHIQRLHSVLDHQLHFVGLGAVRERTYIGTYRHGHAVLQLTMKFLGVIVEKLALPPPLAMDW